MRIGGIERVLVADGQFAPGLAGTQLGPAHHRVGKFKRTVLHHLGIQPAVRAEVDVLEKNAPHRGIDFCARLVGLDFNGGGAGDRGEGQRAGEQNSQQFWIHILFVMVLKVEINFSFLKLPAQSEKLRVVGLGQRELPAVVAERGRRRHAGPARAGRERGNCFGRKADGPRRP